MASESKLGELDQLLQGGDDDAAALLAQGHDRVSLLLACAKQNVREFLPATAQELCNAAASGADWAGVLSQVLNDVPRFPRFYPDAGVQQTRGFGSFDLDALVRFVVTDAARREAIKANFASSNTDGTTLFQALRTIGSKFDPNAPSDPVAAYQNWEFKAAAGPTAAWTPLLHGEVLRLRGWADAAASRRESAQQLAELECTHHGKARMCPEGENVDLEDLETGTEVYRRVFSIQADRVGDGTGVTVRVQLFMYKRKNSQSALQWAGWFSGGPTHVEEVFSKRCVTVEELHACLSEQLGIGFRDVLLFVHGYNNSLRAAEERALLLRRKSPNDGMTVGVFSFNSHESTLSYNKDEEQATHPTSVKWLADTISVLRQCQEHRVMPSEPIANLPRVHILAHSLGNRITLKALEAAAGDKMTPRPLVGELVLASADVGVSSDFTADVALLLPEMAHAITQYYNPSDKALWVSEKLHRESRIGQSPLLIGTSWTDVGPWNAIETLSGDAVTHHADFANQIWCRRDLHTLLTHGWEASRRPSCVPTDGIMMQYSIRENEGTSTTLCPKPGCVAATTIGSGGLAADAPPPDAAVEWPAARNVLPPWCSQRFATWWLTYVAPMTPDQYDESEIPTLLQAYEKYWDVTRSVLGGATLTRDGAAAGAGVGAGAGSGAGSGAGTGDVVEASSPDEVVVKLSPQHPDAFVDRVLDDARAFFRGYFASVHSKTGMDGELEKLRAALASMVGQAQKLRLVEDIAQSGVVRTDGSRVCVDDTLIDQLYRLAGTPHTATIVHTDWSPEAAKQRCAVADVKKQLLVMLAREIVARNAEAAAAGSLTPG